MKARNGGRISALRSLAAALDNATAVPLPPGILANENVEVQRKALSPDEVRAVLMREIAERRGVAFVLSAHGRFEKAAAIEAEIEILSNTSTRHDHSFGPKERTNLHDLSQGRRHSHIGRSGAEPAGPRFGPFRHRADAAA
jgi:hypothetical protein